jgi:hypothetical protein
MKSMNRLRLVCLIAFAALGGLLGYGQTQAPAGTEPLTLSEVHNLLRRSVGRDMTEGDVAARIERAGIAFDPTPEVINRLRAVGAHPHLLNAIKRAGEKLTAGTGTVVSTRPPAPDPIIEEVRRNVRDYIDELPDFICQQEVVRYFDNGTGAWQKADTLLYELTYNRKRESYKPINTIGRPVTRPLEQAGGAYSTGDFASVLALLFDPETKASFKPAGKEKLGPRPTLIYDFRVPQATSKFQIKTEGIRPIITGYSGSVWVDAETKQVLRIEQAADDLPRDYPVTQAESATDYDLVKLRGLDVEFLLPTRSEFIIADRRARQYSRNLIYFKFYRKFETDVRIVDDPIPPKTDKP